MLAKSSDASKRPLERQFILLVDPRPLTRGWVASFLKSAARTYEIVEAAHVDDLAAPTWPFASLNLAILNIGATSVRDVQTHDEIERLRIYLSDVPLVLLTDSHDVEEIRTALRLGVRGYIPTSLKGTVTLAALRLVLAGGTFVPAESQVVDQLLTSETPAHSDVVVLKSIEESGASRPPVPDLTRREMDVLRLLRQGKANKVIAYELTMSESTVKVHIQHIMRKLKATNRTHVVFLANRYFADASPVG